jgi:serralysin
LQNPENSRYAIYLGQRKTIWDGDGGAADTLDAQALNESVEIDLVAGHLSSIGGLKNIAIAFNSSIERAIGGSKADKLIGNDLVNILTGADGDDELNGGGANDRLEGRRRCRHLRLKTR